MTLPSSPLPKAFSAGIVFALLAILLGFGLGAAFGAVEDQIKQVLDDSGAAVLDSAYQGDVAEKDAVVEKSWRYLLRSHMHGGAIGSVALAAIAILLLVSRRGLLAQASAVALGVGASLYSVFWLWAGFMAPGLGSTGAAKDALEFIAVPGAGLSMLGAVGTLVVVVKDTLLSQADPRQSM